MKLARQDNKIWLERGWPDFSKHYSLKRGSMLMFRYEGNSEFHAVIFDTSTVEIDYPSITLRFDNYDVDLELPEDDSPCPKASEKSPLPCSQPYKRMRASPTQSNLSGPNECVLDRKPDLPDETGRDKSSTRRKRECQIVTSIKTPMDRSKNVAALQKASDFKSKCPFFKVVMQPSYVYGYHLYVPLDFATRYIKNGGDVVLLVPNGNYWCAQFKTSPISCSNRSARLCNGWQEFANGNNLEVGDVCFFELLDVDGNEISFKVSIFHLAESASLQQSQG
ncbi:B3 DNA binding domain containing protein [Trema orientale]|uniref:B3 DNA binding domain containing protein n=1 Tax=Trema orientale TaxID=63057 RepID=A0A2P5FY37_TREOI|nr:B3 DNA binding domain containing protein [Trema orientale]